MYSKDLAIGDLVWAKMKNFPFWPGKIIPPRETNSSNPKKAAAEHYVYFFGSGNHSWILDEYIVPHSEGMVNSSKKKKASLLFQSAIEEITKAAVEVKPQVKIEALKAENCDDLSQASTSSEPKKEKVRKNKNKNSFVKAPKRRLSRNEKSVGSLLSRAPKALKLGDDLPSAMSIGSTTTETSRIAVIRPFDDASSSLVSKYIARPSTPYLDIATVSDTLKVKHVEPTQKKIGFLGLGMMGRGIVKNLLNSNHHVMVWNRTPDKCEDFVKAGATRGQTPMEVVKANDIIFCCISDAEAVKSVIFGAVGVLQGLKGSVPGAKGYVEMSSIDDETSHDIAEAICNEGGRYLEAPITGNRQLAEEGTITVLGSGDRALFSDCETCFHAMSKNAYYISCVVGESAKFSLTVNMLMGTVCGAMAEALALAKRIEVSQREFLDLLQISGFTPAMVLEKGRAILDQNFVPNTPLKHQQKDINLGLGLSHAVGQPMPVAASANELYKHAKLLGYSEHDVAAVYQGAKF